MHSQCKGDGRVGNRRTNGEHPDYGFAKIGQNTEKSPGDLRRLLCNTISERRGEKLARNNNNNNNNNNNDNNNNVDQKTKNLMTMLKTLYDSKTICVKKRRGKTSH